MLDGHCRPSHKSKKDTKRWCKGKPGVEHDYRWVAYEDLPNAPYQFKDTSRPDYRNKAELVWEFQVCAACGKQRYPTRNTHRNCGGVVTSTKQTRIIQTTWGKHHQSAFACDKCHQTLWR